MVAQTIQYGAPLDPDPYSYYQLGGAHPPRYTLLWGVTAGIYSLLSLGQPFNKDLLFMLVKFLPAFFGALIAVASYWLGKEAFGKKVGLLLAFAVAVTPAFVYRQMAGFFEEDSFGFLWMIIGFVFLIRAVKSAKLERIDIQNAALAGVFFGVMAITWEMYLLIPLILAAYFVFGVLLLASNEESTRKEVINFIIKMAIAWAIFAIISLIAGANWLQSISALLGSFLESTLNPFLTLGIMLVLFAISSIIAIFFSNKKSDTKKYFSYIVLALIIISLIAMAAMFLSINDTADRTRVASMVGEESTGKQFFGTKYNSLILFTVLKIGDFPLFTGLLLFPIFLYLYRKRESHIYLIFFFWIAITLFMAWYKLKFTYTFGLGVALGAGFFCFALFELLKKYNVEKIYTKIAVILVLFLLLSGLGAASRFIPDYKPFNDENPQWTDAMLWIKSNTPADAKLLNWWDQGHILAWLTERKVSTDNRNYEALANQQMARFITTTDTNAGYQIASKEVGADYIILSSDMITGIPSFEYYANDRVDQNLIRKYYTANLYNEFMVLDCSEEGTLVKCGSNTIPISDFNTFATTWKSVPDDFRDGKIPQFIYRTANELVVLNPPLNKTNIAKVWLNSDETKGFYEEVYSKRGIKIFKIIK
jgi:dolichyl-diphosphooligosaccharide--protein glycosyltransferase